MGCDVGFGWAGFQLLKDSRKRATLILAGTIPSALKAFHAKPALPTTRPSSSGSSRVSILVAVPSTSTWKPLARTPHP
jgi:hypothetical protein